MSDENIGHPQIDSLSPVGTPSGQPGASAPGRDT
jgi:hypothetical protein